MALWHGASAGHARAVRRGDAELARDDGRVAVESDAQCAEGDAQLGTKPSRGHPSQAGDGVRSLLLDR